MTTQPVSTSAPPIPTSLKVMRFLSWAGLALWLVTLLPLILIALMFAGDSPDTATVLGNFAALGGMCLIPVMIISGTLMSADKAQHGRIRAMWLWQIAALVAALVGLGLDLSLWLR